VLFRSGELESRRREQRRAWLWDELEAGLRQALREHPAVAGELPALEARVAAGEETPEAAARQLLAAFRR